MTSCSAVSSMDALIFFLTICIWVMLIVYP
jgi:hypothetical protein